MAIEDLVKENLERLKKYRENFDDPEFLKFVESLELIFEWIEELREDKRLRESDEEMVEKYSPKKIFEELDKVLLTKELTPDKSVELREIFLKDAEAIIAAIVKTGRVRISDFDSVQFNLYQVFGKDRIASMVENIRLNVDRSAKKLKERKALEFEKKRKEQEDYLRKLREMPRAELNKLMIKNMFDFSPSARTPKERKKARDINRKKVVTQVSKFENFAERLADASEVARRDSQTNVFRKIGEARIKVKESADNFKEEAKKIASPEGPKRRLGEARKEMGKAKSMVLNQKKGFEVAEKKAKKMILTQRDKLVFAENDRRKSIRMAGRVQINRGHDVINLARGHLKNEQEETEDMFEEGRQILEEGKKQMEEEKVETEKFFEVGRQNLTFARVHLREEKSELDERVSKDEKRISDWKKDLTEKKEKEERRIASLKNIILSKGGGVAGLVSDKVEGAGKKIGKKGRERDLLSKSTAIQRKVFLGKKRIEKDVQRKKELLLYDTRFKKFELQKNANKQKEFLAEKFETFQDKQKNLIARHKAKQKANMIRKLLNAMRVMNKS